MQVEITQVDWIDICSGAHRVTNSKNLSGKLLQDTYKLHKLYERCK